MPNRPHLDNNLDSAAFQSYYYLKEELIQFCRREGLQTTGGKDDLNQRIAHFLETGEKLVNKQNSKVHTAIEFITVDTIIESDLICSEKHRAFFKKEIGRSFSFNVLFQNWLKSNAGKTYSDAIEAYHQILDDKKKGKTTIDKQFEYNTYIRDFFADNSGKSLDDAIRCWKYKKSLPGHNKYEKSDTDVLNETC